MPPNLTPADLTAFIQQHNLDAEILHLDSPTPTVETAAQAVGVVPYQIVKSILFTIRDQPVMAISCGLYLVDRRVIGKRYGVGRKVVKMGTPETVLSFTGYPVGGVPPFGHLQAIPTLLDQKVLRHETVYAGGGEHNVLMRLRSADILQVTQADVLDLERPPSE